jgi:lipoate-protein ligase A
MSMPIYETASWRLLHTPPADGAWNMAVDEAVLGAVGHGHELPTLRLYAWQPPCLSLGYAQPAADVDHAALAALGWDLVRRPTGGRAILHADELTYAVIAPHGESRLAGGVLESYRVLAQVLLHSLRLLGIPAQALEKAAAVETGDEANSTHPGEARPPQNPVCFDVPSHYEITASGKKLVGSAQARRKEGVLQHGSLPLYGNLARITQVLSFPHEQARRQAAAELLAHAATAESVLDGQPPTWEQAAAAFTQAFSECLNLDLQHGSLSPAETQHAERLVEEKYAHPDWTFKS